MSSKHFQNENRINTGFIKKWKSLISLKIISNNSIEKSEIQILKNIINKSQLIGLCENFKLDQIDM